VTLPGKAALTDVQLPLEQPVGMSEDTSRRLEGGPVQ
jgi:hypothetical protein